MKKIICLLISTLMFCGMRALAYDLSVLDVPGGYSEFYVSNSANWILLSGNDYQRGTFIYNVASKQKEKILNSNWSGSVTWVSDRYLLLVDSLSYNTQPVKLKIWDLQKRQITSEISFAKYSGHWIRYDESSGQITLVLNVACCSQAIQNKLSVLKIDGNGHPKELSSLEIGFGNIKEVLFSASGNQLAVNYYEKAPDDSGFNQGNFSTYERNPQDGLWKARSKFKRIGEDLVSFPWDDYLVTTDCKYSVCKGIVFAIDIYGNLKFQFEKVAAADHELIVQGNNVKSPEFLDYNNGRKLIRLDATADYPRVFGDPVEFPNAIGLITFSEEFQVVATNTLISVFGNGYPRHKIFDFPNPGNNFQHLPRNIQLRGRYLFIKDGTFTKIFMIKP